MFIHMHEFFAGPGSHDGPTRCRYYTYRVERRNGEILWSGGAPRIGWSRIPLQCSGVVAIWHADAGHTAVGCAFGGQGRWTKDSEPKLGRSVRESCGSSFCCQKRSPTGIGSYGPTTLMHRLAIGL
jgi:hypothetical protein